MASEVDPGLDSQPSRMQELLEAIGTLGVDLDLPDVLRRIVGAACSLAGARYGALGIVDDDRLSDFIALGLTPEEVEAIGPLPTGRGVLGVLLEHPHPLRLAEVADHPASVGFPPGHPPMHTFLGVPLRVGDQVFGNLYLANPAGAEPFTESDEQIVVALAAAAGSAIKRTRLLELAEQRARWLSSAAEITRVLVSDAPRGEALHVVARRALQGASADLAAVLLPDDSGLLVDVAEGVGAAALDGAEVQGVPTLIAALRDPEPRVIVGRAECDAVLVPRGAPVAGWPTLERITVVPMCTSSAILGLLLLGGEQPGRQQSAEDLHMVSRFAEQAALALELAGAQADRARLAVYEDRDRIARDLHDEVVQRLFAVGLSLRGATRDGVPEEQRVQRMRQAVVDLGETSARIRSTIMQLHVRPGEGSLAADLEDLVVTSERLLGWRPSLSMTGNLARVPEDVGDDMLAVIREALANVARHARAHHASVQVVVGDALDVTVVDDGVGISEITRTSGLRNMAERAGRHGGTSSVVPAEPNGTRMRWRAPLPPEE